MCALLPTHVVQHPALQSGSIGMPVTYTPKTTSDAAPFVFRCRYPYVFFIVQIEYLIKDMLFL